jgi:hypothetical protein
MKTRHAFLLFLCLQLFSLVSLAQLQVPTTTTFQLQQSLSKLRFIQNLPLSASSLNDTTSAFAFRQNSSRRTAEGGVFASVSGGALEPLKISDYKDTLINGVLKSFSYQTINPSSFKTLGAYCQNIISAGAAFGFVTRTSNFANEIIEVRTYRSAKVRSIELPRLSASLRDQTAFKVELEAPSVTTTYPGGTETGSRIISSNRKSFSNLYRASMSGMTTSNSRISDISAIKITAGPSAFSGVPYQLTDFSIELPTTFAQEYTQWLQSPNRASDLRTFTVAYLDQSMRTDLVFVELMNVEIISMSNVPVPSGAIAKTRVGLRAQKIKVTVR